MAEFKCKNKDCRAFDVSVKYFELNYRGLKDSSGDTVPDEAVCPSCGEIMEQLNKQKGFGGNIISYNPNPRKPIY